MLNTQLSNLAANEQLNALAALASNGYLRMYSGAQPISADMPITTQVLLAELRFGTPAFGTSVSGVITANAITDESDAPATGIATWFRVFKSDGITVLWDGTIGTTGNNINLNSTAIQTHARVSLTSYTHTLPKAGA